MPFVQVSACLCTLKPCGTGISGFHQGGGSPRAGALREPAAALGIGSRLSWYRLQEAHWMPLDVQSVPAMHLPQKKRPLLPLPAAATSSRLTMAPSSLTPACCSHSISSHSKYWTRRLSKKLLPWRNLPMIATIEISSSSPRISCCKPCNSSNTLLSPSWSTSTPSILARLFLSKRPTPWFQNSTSTASALPGIEDTRPSLPDLMLRSPPKLLNFTGWPCSFRRSLR
mmetsp:Transcript_104474/g.207533  ORF Transcript_104474/g.207533 Transcript_104474/m.207533 type:complete len:227 (-) Transcript_104474:192-872(-)